MNARQSADSAREKSIEDFGDQWTRYTDNSGFYGSTELFGDMLSGLLRPEDFAGREVIDVGSGTGRIVRMLLAADAAKVHAIEPSKAIDVLRDNTADSKDRVALHNVAGDEIPPLAADLAVSIGVLHHIPEPGPVVKRVFDTLKPGGAFLFWVYGKEGNESYLKWILPLRKITHRLPDWVLRILSHLLNILLSLYILLCRFLPLPLRDYMNQVIGNFSWQKRFLVIFDQLNPIYAKYYTREEALALMRSGGFDHVRCSHRHGYSWTVVGVKPHSS